MEPENGGRAGKRKFLLETIISRVHVSFVDGTYTFTKSLRYVQPTRKPSLALGKPERPAAWRADSPAADNTFRSQGFKASTQHGYDYKGTKQVPTNGKWVVWVGGLGF